MTVWRFIFKMVAQGICRNVGVSTWHRIGVVQRLFNFIVWTLAIVERNGTKRYEIKHTASFA